MGRRGKDAGEAEARGRRSRLRRGRRRANPDAGEPLGEGLRALLSAMGGTPGRAGLQNLWDNWEAVLGAELAALARPLGHHDVRKDSGATGGHGEAAGAVLLLGAGDAMLLQELRFRGEEILTRVNGYLGNAYFSEVQVSLPLGRGEPVRSRQQVQMTAKEEAHPPVQSPSGIFLDAMDRASPVARCYARFAGIEDGRGKPERPGGTTIRKNDK